MPSPKPDPKPDLELEPERPPTDDRDLAGWLAELEAELRRVPDRLRELSALRLAAVADAARAVAQELAEGAAGIEGRGLPDPPRRQTVPRLADHAIGDQLTVTGTDLRLACRGVPAGTTVWAGQRRQTVEKAVRRGVESLAGLRRLI